MPVWVPDEHPWTIPTRVSDTGIRFRTRHWSASNWRLVCFQVWIEQLNLVRLGDRLVKDFKCMCDSDFSDLIWWQLPFYRSENPNPDKANKCSRITWLPFHWCRTVGHTTEHKTTVGLTSIFVHNMMESRISNSIFKEKCYRVATL